MLPPLDAPHHLRKHEWAAFREGNAYLVNKCKVVKFSMIYSELFSFQCLEIASLLEDSVLPRSGNSGL